MTPSTWLIDTTTGDLARPLAELALDRGGRVLLTGPAPADLADLRGAVQLVARERGSAPAAAAAVRTAVDVLGPLDVVVTAATPAAGPAAALAAELDAAVLLEAALPALRPRAAVLHLTRTGAPWLDALPAGPGVRVTVADRGTDPADPRRLARLLADVVTGGHAPRRLVLGAAALHRSRQALQARAQELEVWAGVSRAADPVDAPVRAIDRGVAGVLHLVAPAA